MKEWLCLNCQMERAVAASQPARLPAMVPEKAKASPSKVPLPAAAQLKETPKTTPPIKDGQGSVVTKTEASQPVSQQEKPCVPQTQTGKLENAKSPSKQASQVPENKPAQDRPQSGPIKAPDASRQPSSKQGDSSAATQQQSSGFFGFGAIKSQPDAAKPAVTEKMFGFGSSIFSSASTLITSAVQDQPKTTPPVSPKMSPAKVVKPSPSVQKLEQEKKPELTQTVTSKEVKIDKAQTGPQKSEKASAEAARRDSSTCPLCKTELNRGTKDPPNYNSCTECKKTVCKQCGFNPMPNETGVSLDPKPNKFIIIWNASTCYVDLIYIIISLINLNMQQKVLILKAFFFFEGKGMAMPHMPDAESPQRSETI